MIYRYQLVRYISDLMRCEPRNFGVIVQAESGTRWRYNESFQTRDANNTRGDCQNRRAHLTHGISRVATVGLRHLYRIDEKQGYVLTAAAKAVQSDA